MPFELKSLRIIIRDMKEEDTPALLKYWSEPAARSGILFHNSDEEANKEDINNAIAWAKNPQRQSYKLTVLRRSNNIVIGSCGLHSVYPESVEAYMEWHIGNKYWGNGYATEAASELLYLGFMINNVSLISADSFADNQGSIRVMEKIGMTQRWNIGLGHQKNANGEIKPTIRYQICKKEWLTQNS